MSVRPELWSVNYRTGNRVPQTSTACAFCFRSTNVLSVSYAVHIRFVRYTYVSWPFFVPYLSGTYAPDDFRHRINIFAVFLSVRYPLPLSVDVWQHHQGSHRQVWVNIMDFSKTSKSLSSSFQGLNVHENSFETGVSCFMWLWAQRVNIKYVFAYNDPFISQLTHINHFKHVSIVYWHYSFILYFRRYRRVCCNKYTCINTERSEKQTYTIYIHSEKSIIRTLTDHSFGVARTYVRPSTRLTGTIS